ncbi:Iq Domain-Containing Protein H [Manis pentadactyla]|nr:Iq Domain-Containing Protein H [Manis pentadactyla]
MNLRELASWLERRKPPQEGFELIPPACSFPFPYSFGGRPYALATCPRASSRITQSPGGRDGIAMSGLPHSQDSQHNCPPSEISNTSGQTPEDSACAHPRLPRPHQRLSITRPRP